jgi:hydroxymethylbilane synthase
MNSARKIRLGTRGSRLALWQAKHVKALIAATAGAPPVEIVIISTQGDRIQDVPLSQVQGQAFFTKEIEQALLDERIDLAVHSMKDLATVMPEGLALAAVPEREDHRDVLLSRSGHGLHELAAGATLGTSSLRRKAFVAHRRPDLELRELRGNVPTRIAKLDAGEYDAILLAAAGVKRLGLGERISAVLDPAFFPPAPGQGALALQTREKDDATRSWLEALEHAPTRQATTAERSLLRGVEGGCQVPVGVSSTIAGGTLELFALVSSLDGTGSVEGSLRGSADRAAEVGQELAATLLAQGGDRILAAIRNQNS